MSQILERLARGDYISKRECFEHADEIARALDAYPRAMAAMEAHEALMAECVCDWDGDTEDGVTRCFNTPPAGGCPAHPED